MEELINPLLLTDKIIGAQVASFFPETHGEAKLVAKRLLIVEAPTPSLLEPPPLLGKMMEACQINSDEYEVIMLQQGKQYSWLSLKLTYQPEYIITFGQVWLLLGLQAHLLHQKIQKFHGCTWLVTESLDLIMESEELKKILWQKLLKPVFVGE